MMRFSRIEIQHLFRAWLLVSIAFAIAFAGFSLDTKFWIAVAVSGLTAGIGFIGHELMHKFVAQKHRCWAEFRANDFMLGLMLLFSFLGFIFAAPGGVFIRNHVTWRKNGIIALAGPLTNLALGFVFAVFIFILPTGLKPIGNYGMQINFFLGFFNMLPLPGIDGSKVLAWNKAVYVIVFLVSIFLAFSSTTLIKMLGG
ncbi:MAG: metalloprotease [Candidatus Woesearchaeota archaeon]